MNNHIITGVSGKLTILSLDRSTISSFPEVNVNWLYSVDAIPIEWKYMYMKDGIDFAEFIVDTTCKIHRFQSGLGTCGGPIDILLLTKDGGKWIRHKVFKPET